MGQPRKLQNSAMKTGGNITVQNLRPEDIDPSEYIGRDAVTVIEGEFRQFERRFEIVKRFVEHIVSGQFMQVKGDVDLSQNREAASSVVAADSYQVELDLLKAQQTWINRINSLFTCSLGLLAGMSVLHIILISYITDQSRFIDLYAPFAMIFNLFLLILANFSMVLGVAIALIYK